MKKRDLIIVLAVLAFGVIYNFIESGEIRFIDGCSRGQYNLINTKYPNSFPRQELYYADSGIKEIELDNIAGGIEVIKSVDGVIRIQPMVRVYHQNPGSASDIEKSITISPIITNEENRKLSVEVSSTREFNYNRTRVYFKVIIPDNVQLSLWNSYGDVVIDGAGQNIKINNKHGDIGVKRVTTALSVQHKHGKLVLKDIKGALDIYSNYSRISVTDVTSIKLNCAHAQVSLTNIQQETTVEATSYSDIKCQNGNGFTFDGRYTDLHLKDIKNRVSIIDSHSFIGLEDITGNVNIQTKHCRIRLKQIVANEVDIRNEYNNIDLNAITAKKMAVQLSHGNLDIDFIEIAEQLDINNSYSRIKLFYPKTFQPSFDIEINYGEFKNNTTTQFAPVNDDNHIKINHVDRDPKITIVTSYNNIQLNNNTYSPIQRIEDGKITQPNTPPLQKVETEEFKKIEEN